jgi:pyruvate, orthophosphate dikinase
MSASTAFPDLFFIGTGNGQGPLTPELAGSKAANLWQMAKLGLKVPPAFVLSTRLCHSINASETHAEVRVQQLLARGIGELERTTGRTFGDARNPLLVSVRSGAARSMPGMLDTILNIGMTPQSVHGLIRLTGNPRLAWDSYRRFVQTYTEVTGNTRGEAFAANLAAAMAAEDIKNEAQLDPVALERLTADFLEEAAKYLGHPQK